MYTRFDQEIHLNAAQYDRAVDLYADPSHSATDLIEIKPKVATATNQLKTAGLFMLVTATPETFTGAWFMLDGVTTNGTRYEDMLERQGISRESPYTSATYNQHLVGGKRLYEGIFTLTSLFRTDAIHGGHPMAEAKNKKIARMSSKLMSGRTPVVGEFGYDQFMRVAEAVGKKKKS